MEPLKLPPELIAKIGKAQQRVQSLIAELDKCENCGMDVAKLREVITQQLQTLQALDANFGTPLYQQTTHLPLPTHE